MALYTSTIVEILLFIMFFYYHDNNLIMIVYRYDIILIREVKENFLSF